MAGMSISRQVMTPVMTDRHVDVISGAHPQAVVFAGGSFGEYLEKQGMAAMYDYAETCLVDLSAGRSGARSGYDRNRMAG